jgi:2-oxoglutarate ferredoxin oxidoreductase subunit delta
MVKIEINGGQCKGCCLCVAACPLGNIRMSEVFNASGHNYAEIIDKDTCTCCALCCQMCPDVAIEIGPETQGAEEPATGKKTRRRSRLT